MGGDYVNSNLRLSTLDTEKGHYQTILRHTYHKVVGRLPEKSTFLQFYQVKMVNDAILLLPGAMT